jgi:hypothetical protein
MQQKSTSRQSHIVSCRAAVQADRRRRRDAGIRMASGGMVAGLMRRRGSYRHRTRQSGYSYTQEKQRNDS